MTVRVCCLLLACGLDPELLWAHALELPVEVRAAQESSVSSQTTLVVERQLQVRQSGFEHQSLRAIAPLEDVRIFTPLSPVILEAEPVKLPADQEID